MDQAVKVETPDSKNSEKDKKIEDKKQKQE